MPGGVCSGKVPWSVQLEAGTGHTGQQGLAKRAVFIKKSFPYELANATLEYLKLNLRDNVSSQIPIDVPDKGDYRFHLDADNDDSQ